MLGGRAGFIVFNLGDSDDRDGLLFYGLAIGALVETLSG